MLVLTPQGLYCPAGNFHIDPSGAVDVALITHAHSDHARRGSKMYYSASCGVELVKGRLGKKIEIIGIPYGEKFTLGGVSISFHPAGHILGSAQIRMEYNGEVWVASGDYKRDEDPTCGAFEVVPCDVFITEATFGTPSFCWDKTKDVAAEIFDWWKDNALRGINSVIFAYSLGKSQRLLGILKDHIPRPIYCHPTMAKLTQCYRDHGIPLAETICLSTLPSDHRLEGELIIAPPSFLENEQAKVLGNLYQTAFASGWVHRRTQGFDRGFLLSDHADWNDLLKTIEETKARRVYVQHRGNGALVRHLRKLGLEAFSDSELRFGCQPQQLSLQLE